MGVLRLLSRRSTFRQKPLTGSAKKAHEVSGASSSGLETLIGGACQTDARLALSLRQEEQAGFLAKRVRLFGVESASVQRTRHRVRLLDRASVCARVLLWLVHVARGTLTCELPNFRQKAYTPVFGVVCWYVELSFQQTGKTQPNSPSCVYTHCRSSTRRFWLLCCRISVPTGACMHGHDEIAIDAAGRWEPARARPQKEGKESTRLHAFSNSRRMPSSTAAHACCAPGAERGLA
eukprot:5276920-Pleurochrysis_carterae.AAC.1